MAASAEPKPLFTIPIPPCGAEHPGGRITCTEPRAGVYVLAWASPPDNRLTAPFCGALLAALDALEGGGWAPGVVVTTSAIAKFYSNGLDLSHAVATDGFWPLLYRVWHRFLTFPMPTIALLNGHTFAGGLMLAMAHDYRLAPSPRGYLCLNELLFGAPLKPAMVALFRHKLPAATFRALALEARRFGAAAAPPSSADTSSSSSSSAHTSSTSTSSPGGCNSPPARDDMLSSGLADALAPRGLADALAFIDARGLGGVARSGVYGTIKAEMHAPILAYLVGPGRAEHEARFEAARRDEERRRADAREWYRRWAAGGGGGGGAKL